MPCDFTVWTPSWTGWHIFPRCHARQPGSGINTCSETTPNANFSSVQRCCSGLVTVFFPAFPEALFLLWIASFRSLPRGKWSFVHLFDLSVANVSKASYHDIRNIGGFRGRIRGSTFCVCGRNPIVWPFKRNLFSKTFTFYGRYVFI